MTISSIDETQRKALKATGMLYLLMFLTAPWGLMVVPEKLKEGGALTADLIRQSEWLIRLGIASELFHQAIAIFLVLALYRLFKPVSEIQARLLVALGALVSVPIMFMNVLNQLAVLLI